MVEVVKTSEDIIPLTETPFRKSIKPRVSNEALSLAMKHGFYLESEPDAYPIILARDGVPNKKTKAKVILGTALRYIEYIWEIEDPFYYYRPENSLSDKAPYCYKEHIRPVPDWVREFARLVNNQPLPQVLLDQLL